MCFFGGVGRLNKVIMWVVSELWFGVYCWRVLGNLAWSLFTRISFQVLWLFRGV